MVALLKAATRPDVGVSLLFGLIPLLSPLAIAAGSETSNDATRAALRAAVARAAGEF